MPLLQFVQSDSLTLTNHRDRHAGPDLYRAWAVTAERVDRLSEEQRALYEAVPVDGSTVTNRALRSALGWTADSEEDRYFAARNAVEDAGLIARWRG